MAWLAGLLEGEGTFFPVKSHVKGKMYVYPHIGLCMTDRDIVARVGDMFGTKVFHFGHGRKQDGSKGLPIFRVTISGARAIAFMKAILPYMGIRRSLKITETIEKYESQPDQNERRRKWSTESQAKRKREKATA